MADHFRTGAETLPKGEQQELIDWMKRSYTQVAELEAAFVAGAENGEQLSLRFKAISQNCKDCHAKYRN
jgi:cytochrome c556